MTSPRPKRQSASVYRRRRLVVGVLAVALVLLLWWMVSSLTDWFSDGQEEQPTSTATEAQQDEEGQDEEGQDEEGQESPADEDDADSTDDDGPESTQDEVERPEGSCAPSDIEVIASTGEDTYGPDEAPLLIMEIEHTGGEECTLDVGTEQQDFSISHAGREVFTTQQCADDGESYELETEPGQVETAQLTWPRSDSSDDCTEPAELTPGDYELVVSLGEVSSQPHEFTLTEG